MFLRFLWITAALFMPAMLFGQNGNATISGIVQDSHLAAVVGAKISIRNIDNNATRELLVSSDGEFTVTNLTPGQYELRVAHDGFKTHVQTGIVLELGQVLRTEVQMHVGNVTESVTISTDASLINTEVGAIKGDVILQKEINDMPLDGRDFTDLAVMSTTTAVDDRSEATYMAKVSPSRSPHPNYR